MSAIATADLWDLADQERLAYRYPVEQLAGGASLGNRETFAVADRASDLAAAWCSDGQYYAGAIRLDLRLDGEPLAPRDTLFAPLHQTTEHRRDGVLVAKTFFVPFRSGPQRLVYLVLTARNASPKARRLEVRVQGSFRAPSPGEVFLPVPGHQQEKEFQLKLMGTAVVAATLPGPGRQAEEHRAFGCPQPPAEYDFADPGRFRLVYRFDLPPESRREIPFALAMSREGEAAALEDLARIGECRAVFRESRRILERLLELSDLYTPSPVINRGVRWAKVNLLRVQHHYPGGPGFTNDPPQDILVVRDAAWYALGADYLTPAFTRRMLQLVGQEAAMEDGKLAEFLRLADRPVSRDDYGLSLNDDTPLFILACHHHWAATAGRDFLVQVLPSLRRAADRIISQTRGGLVRCEAPGTNVRGIAGWRNVIPGYRLDGAVTEINAACAAALFRLAELCRHAADPAGAQRYAAAAVALRENIRSQLVSPRTGLYLLARDGQGRERHDRTGDQVFPLLYDLADEELKGRVLDLLTGPDFWSPFGCRTVGRDEPGYDPAGSAQLMGGVWANLTAWVAYAARRVRPALVARAMEQIYSLSEVARPRDYGRVCPGQFPERLHGETFESCGMALSPWMPPTYLWLGLEGLAGLEPAVDGPLIQPHLPPQWTWLAAGRVPLGGGRLSWFLHQGTLYATAPVRSPLPVEVFPEEVTELFPGQGFRLALARGNEVALFLASAEGGVATWRLPGSDREHRVSLAAGEARLVRLQGVRLPRRQGAPAQEDLLWA